MLSKAAHRCWLWLPPAALCAVMGCVDLSGPQTELAFLGFTPALNEEEADIYRSLPDYSLGIDNVRLVLRHENGEPALDTMVMLQPGQESVVFDVAVRLHGPQELLEASVALRSGADVMFAGLQDVPAKRGGYLTSRPPPMDMAYVGPGAFAASLIVGPNDTTIAAADSMVFHPRLFTHDGIELSAVGVAWTVSDANQGAIGMDGVFRPSGRRGAAYVIGRLPRGLMDSTLVSYVPKPY